MNVNPDKCHLLTSTTASIAIKVKDNEILNSESEKLLKKANQKVHVLARITP